MRVDSRTEEEWQLMRQRHKRGDDQIRALWIIPNGGHGPIFGDMTGGFVETAMAFLRGEWERAEGVARAGDA